MKSADKRRSVIATVIVFLILITPTLSSGWGAGGHMMTASIAFDRLKPHARAKVKELLAIEIEPVIEVKSKDFINASHWADDIKSVEAFEFLDPFHYINRPFTDDGTPLPTDLPKPENILKGLEDNVKILKTSPDKNAQARALRLIIHFVGDIHQPLHNVTRATHARPGGDLGGNLFIIKRLQPDGTLKNSNLHSYWDAGIDTFPLSGPPPTYIPPPLSDIPPAVAQAKKGNPPTNKKLKLKQPFNFKLWSDESFALAKDLAYKIEEGSEPSAAYKAKATPVVRRRVAWGGYRLAALLNAIWP
jgi:hypothetical protein